MNLYPKKLPSSPRRRINSWFSPWLLIFALIFAGATGVHSQTQANRGLTILTEPEAQVLIDGVLYGKADEEGVLKISYIRPASKNVRVRKYGFQEATAVITPANRGGLKIPLTKTTDEATLSFQDAERLTAIDRPKAAAAYRKAISLKKDFPEAYVGLARTLVEQGSIEEAFKAIETALKLRPVYPEAITVHGRLLKDTGEEEKAIATFGKAISAGRGFQPEAYTGLGILYQERAENAVGAGEIASAERDYELAAENFRKAIDQLGGAPDAAVVYQLLGRIYENQMKAKDAIALYKEFLDRFPDSVEAPAVRSFIVQLEKQLSDQ